MTVTLRVGSQPHGSLPISPHSPVILTMLSLYVLFYLTPFVARAYETNYLLRPLNLLSDLQLNTPAILKGSEGHSL